MVSADRLSLHSCFQGAHLAHVSQSARHAAHLAVHLAQQRVHHRGRVGVDVFASVKDCGRGLLLKGQRCSLGGLRGVAGWVEGVGVGLLGGVLGAAAAQSCQQQSRRTRASSSLYILQRPGQRASAPPTYGALLRASCTTADKSACTLVKGTPTLSPPAAPCCVPPASALSAAR
jgi:hypothetical protein